MYIVFNCELIVRLKLNIMIVLLIALLGSSAFGYFIADNTSEDEC